MSPYDLKVTACNFGFLVTVEASDVNCDGAVHITMPCVQAPCMPTNPAPSFWRAAVTVQTASSPTTSVP